ncbi:MAG TPA: LLM class flavin-dependent oxidoreductase [Polyangia bacterium]|nr:LLM class flavin-dependent oxidoreductase [Polyangia bacterium]
MVPLSVLDLAPIVEGADASQALGNSRDLARHAERWGYQRFWLAEHHNMPGIASAATSIAIAHVAAGTSSIRVGAGGIMLPNHAPLVIAEQFGTLDALYPGRIDLGLGRAPGTDQPTARALRRTLVGDVDRFPEDVVELLGYFHPSDAGDPVRAYPGAGANVEVWILGSSLFGAEMAAAMGLPFAFASHFAPALMMEAAEIYRNTFRPSVFLDRSRLMLGVNVVAADTDDEARVLLTSLQQAFVNLRSGRPGRLPPPRPGFADALPAHHAAMLAGVLAEAAVGSRETVGQQLQELLDRTGADELILTAQIYDHGARLRSFEIAAEVGRQLRGARA